jgi:uncharacterized membrane protein
MSPPDSITLFFSLRSLHILAAALWFGAASFISFFLLPAFGRSAPEAIAKLARRRFHVYMGVIGPVTVLSGLFLYWHLFSVVGAGSHAAAVFGIAGAFGLAAAIVGKGVVGKSAERIAELFERTSNLPEHARDEATAQAIVALQQRMLIASRAVVALMAIALVLMSLGHYF